MGAAFGVGWGVCREPWLGYDLAHWQSTSIPWVAARELGIGWAIVKRWHARGIVASAEVQLRTGHEAGIEALGEYAWCLPDQDLDAQIAAWTVSRSSLVNLPLSIDWEDPTTTARGGKLVARLEYVIERTSDRIGCRPIIYTGEWYWKGYCLDVDSEIAASCPLWLAAYPRKNANATRYRDAVAEVCGGVAPAVPRPWRDRGIDPIAWQFDGDKGLYLPNGVDCDVNIADGSALRALLSRLVDTLPAPAPSSGPPTMPQTPTSRSSQRMPAVREPMLDWYPQTDARPFLETLADKDDKPE